MLQEMTQVRAPRGREMSCKGWHQEAALRMLMNNLDPEVAERPEELIVYGGTGRAARNWECFHAMVRALRALENDETLLVQSGKPVGVFRTHAEAPRVLIANANLVGHWSNWEQFWKLERMGLTMYGQMTAGSWIYIGSQGIVQGTYETFAAMARKHFGGSLRGKLVVSGGMGGMGGAQPLAATMNGACFLGVDVDPRRIERRVATGYCDRMETSLDEALLILNQARARGEALSVGLVGNCADVLPELVRRGIVPDALTDQTSAHDPLNGYVPNGMTLDAALALRAADPAEYVKHSMQAMGVHVEAMLALQRKGAVTFDYGNNIRTQAREAGVQEGIRHSGVSCRSTFVRFSVKDAGRSAGWRSPAIPKTSIARIVWRSNYFRKMKPWHDGWSWRAAISASRGCRRAFAGWDMASARSLAWP